MVRTALLIAALVAPLAAEAAPPPLIPVTGYLTDDTGAPVDASVALKVVVYASPSGTQSLWSEVQAVDVDHGQFTTYLGAGTPLGLDLFRDHPDLYLGLAVGTGAEMTPRFHVATAPFAGYALYCDDAATVGGIDPSLLRQTSDALTWSDLDPSTVPAGLADGDDDTTYTAGAGLTLTAGTFAADQAVIQGWAKGVAYDTVTELRGQLDAVYAAKQTCTTNQVLAVDASGAWACTDSTALPIGESFVDAAVANNGYAMATDLTSLTGRVASNEGAVTTLNTSVSTLNTSVSTLNGDVSALQSSVSALQSQLGAGATVDYQYAQTTQALNLPGTIPWDDTIPQISEGSELLAVTITPKKASDLLVLDGTISWTEPVNHSNYFTVAIFRDATANAIDAATDAASNGNGRCTYNGTYTQICTMPIRFTLTAGSTAATTFHLRVGLDGGNVYINQSSSGRRLGGTLVSTFSATEIAQ